MKAVGPVGVATCTSASTTEPDGCSMALEAQGLPSLGCRCGDWERGVPNFLLLAPGHGVWVWGTLTPFSLAPPTPSAWSCTRLARAEGPTGLQGSWPGARLHLLHFASEPTPVSSGLKLVSAGLSLATIA